MIPDSRAIEESLLLAAGRGGDLTLRVYEKLFARHPEMAPLFVRDASGAVRGEMLARAFEAILDFIGPRIWAHRFIQTETVTHEGYGVPREIFGLFFAAIADTVRETLGEEWSPAMENGWRALLGELAFYATHTDQLRETAS